jgi:hypothetical protein
MFGKSRGLMAPESITSGVLGILHPRIPNRLSTEWASTSAQTRTARRLGNALAAWNINAEECSFRLVAYGPVLKGDEASEPYPTLMSIMAALEKALADAMCA